MRTIRTALLAATIIVPVGVPLSGAIAQQDGMPRDGGSMTISFKDDVATLDPAIGYDWQNWPIIKVIFDGLMDYAPGTTTLKPNLAESFSVSQDGKTYTFKLRSGPAFTNGRPVVAQDVVYSIERTCNPKTQSPGASFFGSIAGFDTFNAGKAPHLAGVKAVDDHTVQFTLSRPDATFLQVLALNFALVVPKEEVERPGVDWSKHPVGSGPFMLQSWQLGQKLTLVRNPHYFQKGVPHLDKVVVEVAQEPLTALLRLQSGDIDALGDGIPPAKFNEVMHDPKLKADVVEGPRLETSYITMKVGEKPFSDPRVRLAVNEAINKVRIVRLINGRAAPANQILPPGMPGYDTAFKGAAYDPADAKKQLAAAGYASGFTTDFYANNTDPNPRIAQAIQQDLASIGITANLKTLAQENVIAAAGDPNQGPMVWSGGMAWSDDFPDPADFYTPILSCGSATKGGWNWSFYCNKDLDTQAQAADAITDPNKSADRNAAWAAIYRRVMADNPWVPVFNEKLYVMKSARLQAASPTMFVDPIYTPINYKSVFVTDGK
jgi:peptide/nickel transport system substrate-binding protein/oligopeptide transport system substrate-binding protein